MRKDDYTVYECRLCNKEIILLTYEKSPHDRLSCPYCGQETLRVTGTFDKLKECMEEKKAVEVI